MKTERKPQIQNIYSLTPMQEGMLYNSLANKDSNAYFEQISFNVNNEMDISLLEKSFNTIIERHEILRVVFNHKKAKRPIQIVLKERKASIYYEDISNMEAPDKQKFISSFKEKEKEKGFDLTRDILIKLAVLKIDNKIYKLIFNFHHILMDGWCLGIIMNELFKVYRALVDSKPIELDRVYTYGSYISWLEKQDKKQAREYWKKYLEGYEQQSSLPKLQKTSNHEYKYNDLFFKLDKDTTQGLARIAEKNNATFSTVFQVLWGLILKQLNEVDDVVFGAVVSGRAHEVVGVDKIVGLFINTIPVRVRVDSGKSFNEIVKQLQLSSLESEKYHYSPLAKIQADTELKQDLLDHIIIFENFPLESELSGKDNNGLYGYDISEVDVFEQTNYDFNITILPGNEMTIKLSYNELTYSREFIEKIQAYIDTIVKKVVSNPEIKADEVYVLSADEEKQILLDFNDTKIDYENSKTINKMFEEQVSKTPDETALISGESTLTYRELNERANQLARVLRDKGVSKDDIVGVLIERSNEMLVAIMAVLKAGGAYLPIDPTYPKDRTKYMLYDSGTQILLTSATIDSAEFISIGETPVEIINLDNQKLYSGEVTNLMDLDEQNSSSLAYVIYTSGSTGKPKGVMLEHKSVINFIKGITDKIDFSSGKTILCLTTISFDIFVLESLLPLTKGLKVVIANENEQLNPKELNDVIAKNKVQMIQTTPSRIKMLLDSENTECLKYLKEILLGGEALSKEIKEKLDKLCNSHVYNMYGPTETTVWSTFKEVTKDLELNIGKPIANTQIYIVDKSNRPQPIGVAGELCIAGEGLARGYYNRTELTKEKFVDNPFYKLGDDKSNNTSPLMYRTGDLARWLEDGNIEFLGRLDDQVKVRGYRIELGEIESQLQKMASIKETVVVAKDGKNGAKYICAYVVSESDYNMQEIRNSLSTDLPEYMIPSYFVQIDSIPMTPNGKIDRKALPEPSGEINTGTEFVEPVTELEKAIADIWCEVLEVDTIGINDNFFALGGDSIYMMQVSGKISNHLKVNISIAEFMDNKTIWQLVNLIEKKQKQHNQRDIYPYKEPDVDNIYELFPLTDVQVAYLMGRDEKFEMGGVSTHMYIELETNLDIERFNKAINKLIKRHPMLRAIILPTGQQQILENVPEYKIQSKNLIGMETEDINGYILEERERMSHHIFKSDEWPLFEVKALQLEENKNYLHIGLDMLISDASSMQIIFTEVGQFYTNPDFELPELEFTFRDYMLAYKDFKSSVKFLEDKKYWMSKLEDFPAAPALPLKTDASKITKPRFRRIEKSISKENWNKLKNKAKLNNITPSALLCTAYSQVLGYWSNQEKLAINLTVFNRYPFHEEVEKIIGDFTSIILLDIYLKSGNSFWQKAEEVQKTLMKALEHRHYDGIEFIREISRNRNLGNQVAMPIVFTSMLMDSKEGEHREEQHVEVKLGMTQTSQVYVDHQATEQNGELILIWDYVEDLFEEETIALMFEQYISSLDLLLEDNEYEIGLTSKDQEFVEQYNDTMENIPQTTLTAMLKKQVERVPDYSAVMFKDDSISYKELDEKSNKIANYLKAKGIGKNDYVGVLASRCIDTIVNLIGIVKARAAYVPVDPEYPIDRRSYILENSGCKLMLESDVYTKENISSYSANLEDVKVHPEDVAYVIYTSGSTGKPKGVVISHGAASNTIIDINQKFNVNETDRIIGLSSMCFDLSVYDIFGAFASGAVLVIVEDQRDVLNLIKTVQEKQITIWNSVPAIMDMMVENVEEDFRNASLRLVLLSGDWIPMRLPEKVWNHFTSSQVVSLGGATEASIWSIYYPIKQIKEDWKSIPYGVPMANQTFYVMNYEMEICPLGVSGELYIGGVGVAEGYMNDTEKTKNAFVNHPQFGRIYKTGDYGVLIEDKELGQVYIEFQGRKDHQVKIRGYRIELGEIENCLLNHDFILNATVVDKTDARGKKILCAYYIADDEDLTVDELKVYLGRHVPEYMIPSYFIEIDEIPLTSNGKVNKKALPMPDINTEDTYVAPTNEVEEKLCKIWQETLEIDKVGINDNFFDIGGNSLNATQLITKVRKEFAINMPLREVFGLSNIREIAKYLIENSKKDVYQHDDNLVLLRKGLNPEKHLFLVHAGSGEAEGYMGLCESLDSEYNYWGIKADRLVNYTPRNLTIKGIAERYIKKIKKIQPKGPYQIIGWCVGGTTSFEMVRQLELLGEEVSFFTLLNSFAPDLDFYEGIEEFTLETEIDWVQKCLEDIKQKKELDVNSLNDINKAWTYFIDYAHKNNMEEVILESSRNTIPDNISSIIPNFKTIDLDGLVYYLNVIRTYARARAIYIPDSNISTQVYFYEAMESRISNKNLWNKYCDKNVSFDEVEGTHFSIFAPENVNGLADKINKNLREV